MNPAYAQYPSLADRVVLVTGGASGIGASIVEHFCAQGARVAFLDIDQEAGKALAATLAGRAPRDPLFIACDLCDIAALQAGIARARAHFGPIGVLVNNAANDYRHGMETVSVASWDAGIAVNLRHQFFAAQAVAPDMRALHGGSIINLGSISWMIKQGGMPVYTTAKSAIQGLTRSLARDLGPYGIRVNTLVPGWVMTDKQLRMWVDETSSRQIDENQCLPTRLESADIARMALFLAADDSRMCTAQDFIVDGGWS
ncbi:MAG: SDR family oxidoreductase [Betaproteobacteria bacterium]|nr:SDR family oxidoreductase [Betaproteobacteria bacterium]